MRRFPLRTVLLMAAAVITFIHFWSATHSSGRNAEPPASGQGPVAVDVPLRRPEAGTRAEAQACNLLALSLEAAVRAPEDPAAMARAREQLDACHKLPARACHLGVALEARSPVEAGETPLRELLGSLCARCPAPRNPCATQVVRSLMVLVADRGADLASLRWSLEHAGPGTATACAELLRSLLVPAALASHALTPGQREALAQLAPLCAREVHLPANLLHAAIVQSGESVAGLAALATGAPSGEVGAVRPDRVDGAEGGDKAFDGKEDTGVELTGDAPGSRWEREGALSARFNPPLKRLTTLRVRAQGPGTLRAVIRTESELGLFDPEGETFFVNPTVCRFQGTGQWEPCELEVPLLDVEVLSVFPEQRTSRLQEVELRGVR